VLSAFSNKPRASLLDAIARDVSDAYDFLVDSIRRTIPQSTIILTTINDPSDGIARIPGILEDVGAPDHTVFHCFSGDVSMSRHCVSRGYYLSFAGTVTFKNAGVLREAAAVVPLELMLVETDAPFLAPVPYRGRPNAPYLIPLTVRALAELKGVDEDAVAAATATNAEHVFGAWR